MDNINETKNGFTTLELLLVIAVIGLIMTAISPLFRSTMLGWELKDRQMEVMQQGRVGMEDMIRTMKTASVFAGIGTSNVDFQDADGIDIEYQLNSNELQKRTGGTGSWQALTEPVDSLTFTYYDNSGNVTADIGLVYLIKIELVVSDSESKVAAVTLSSFVMPRKDGASFSLIINEINYNAPGSGGTERRREWVEIYNYGTDDIDLTGWQISDSRNTDVLGIGPGGSTMTLPAGGYAIITANPTDVYTFYTVDPGAIRLQVPDSSIGNGLADSSEVISILDSSGNTVDSVTYDDSWGADGDGDTLERRTFDGASSAPSNWEASSDILSYTAGSGNTVS
jgi:prepilin-type N-terminal cleavage/methylation domain-containing protein